MSNVGLDTGSLIVTGVNGGSDWSDNVVNQKITKRNGINDRICPEIMGD